MLGRLRMLTGLAISCIINVMPMWFGSYAQRAVPGMYKHPKAGVGVIPYGSILCAPLGVLQKGLSKPDAAPPVEWIGVLNITATHASKFTTGLCVGGTHGWLTWSALSIYRSRRKELTQVVR